jgi:hypothetical protein
MDGSYFSALENARFCLPRPWEAPSTRVTDLFALGSTIYEIMTGIQPYAQYTDEEVETCFRRGMFPPVDGIYCGELIKRCWHSEVHSAEEIQVSINSDIQNLIGMLLSLNSIPPIQLSNDCEPYLMIFNRRNWRGCKSGQELIHIVPTDSLWAYREYPSSSHSGQSSLLLDEPVYFSFRSLPVQSEPWSRAALHLFVRIKCLIRCPHLWMYVKNSLSHILRIVYTKGVDWTNDVFVPTKNLSTSVFRTITEWMGFLTIC